MKIILGFGRWVLVVIVPKFIMIQERKGDVDSQIVARVVIATDI